MPATRVSALSPEATPCANTRTWNRRTAAERCEAVAAGRCQGLSRRAACEMAQVPRSTFEHWKDRQLTRDHAAQVARFVETPAGVDFLHRVCVAAHVVLTLMGDCGIRKVGTFFELAGLDAFVACSYGSLQATSQQLSALLKRFGDEQRMSLAPHVAGKEITLCEDETFPERGICLVAVEPVSNFIALEAYAERRDAATWNATVCDAVGGLGVTVIQSTSDEAKALLRHAQDIGAHHSPDLFHGQREITKALALPLHQGVKQALERVEAAQARDEEVEAAQREYAEQPRGRGRPPNWAKRLNALRQELEAATAAHAAATALSDRAQAAWTAISESYHPFHLGSGAPRSPEALEKALTDAVAELYDVAAALHLSTARVARIAKAARLIPKMVATLAFFARGWTRRASCGLRLGSA